MTDKQFSGLNSTKSESKKAVSGTKAQALAHYATEFGLFAILWVMYDLDTYFIPPQ